MNIEFKVDRHGNGSVWNNTKEHNIFYKDGKLFEIDFDLGWCTELGDAILTSNTEDIKNMKMEALELNYKIESYSYYNLDKKVCGYACASWNGSFNIEKNRGFYSNNGEASAIKKALEWIKE